MEFEPISLPDLMLGLGEKFKEGSVRRWLSLLVEEGLVKKKSVENAEQNISQLADRRKMPLK